MRALNLKDSEKTPAQWVEKYKQLRIGTHHRFASTEQYEAVLAATAKHFNLGGLEFNARHSIALSADETTILMAVLQPSAADMLWWQAAAQKERGERETDQAAHIRLEDAIKTADAKLQKTFAVPPAPATKPVATTVAPAVIAAVTPEEISERKQSREPVIKVKKSVALTQDGQAVARKARSRADHAAEVNERGVSRAKIPLADAQLYISEAREAFARLTPFTQDGAEKIAIGLLNKLLLPYRDSPSIMSEKSMGTFEGKSCSIPRQTMLAWRDGGGIRGDNIVVCSDALANNIIPDAALADEAAHYLRMLPYTKDKTGPELLDYARRNDLTADDMLFFARRQKRMTIEKYGPHLGLKKDQMDDLAEGRIKQHPKLVPLTKVAQNFGLTSAEDIDYFSRLMLGNHKANHEVVVQYFTREIGQKERTPFLRGLYAELLKLHNCDSLPMLAQKIYPSRDGEGPTQQAQLLGKQLIRTQAMDQNNAIPPALAAMVADFVFPSVCDKAMHDVLATCLGDSRQFIREKAGYVAMVTQPAAAGAGMPGTL